MSNLTKRREQVMRGLPKKRKRMKLVLPSDKFIEEFKKREIGTVKEALKYLDGEELIYVSYAIREYFSLNDEQVTEALNKYGHT